MNIVVVASRSRGLFSSLQEMLGEEFDLHFAERLSQVFEALATRPTDLVFIDARLADCDGRDAIREIAAAFPEACLVYLSPPEDGGGPGLSDEEGVYASLRKPLSQEIVRFLARKATERKKLSRRIEYLTSVAGTTPMEEMGRMEERLRATSRETTSAFLGTSMVRKLLRSLSPIMNLSELLARFADSIRELFGSNNVAIFTWDPAKGRYTAGAWQGIDEALAQLCSFSNKHPMVRWFLEHRQLLTRDKLRTAFAHDVAAEIGTDMDALRCDVIMPLLEKGSLIGFLSLGKKMTGKRYEEADLELLAVIGDCASGAISMAAVYRELLLSKARTDSILDNIACGIVSVGADARIVNMNCHAEKAFDVNAEELVGKRIQKLGSVLADMVLRTYQEEEFTNYPYRDLATGRLLSVSTSKVRDERLNLVGVILFFTELDEAATTASAETLIPEDADTFALFCANIADKIKNPLASIKTFSQLLPEKFEDSEFRQKFGEIVGKAVERINSLADGLTSYAETGPLDLTPTNLVAVVENAMAALRKSLNARNIRFDAPGSGKPAMALADGQLIRSAFLRVLRNSIESTPTDGTITISIKEVTAKHLRRPPHNAVVFDYTGIAEKDGAVSDDEVFLETEFRDSGKGISDGRMGQIGQPFFTTKGDKVGLGLAITRQIIIRHSGRIEVGSKETEGTTVKIVLPRGKNK